MSRSGRAGAGWLVGAAAASGVGTYVLLVVAAAGLDAGFDLFSVFWSFLMVAVIGGFLPLEQVVARRVAGAQAVAVLVRPLLVWGAIVVVVATAVFAALWRGPGAVVLVLAGGVLAMVPQATVRGVAAGRQHLRAYGLVIVTDSALRAVVCGVLAAAGVRELVAYTGAIAVSAWVGAGVGALALRRTMPVEHPTAPALPAGTAAPMSLAREAGSVGVALLGMQLVLNSPVVLADVLATASAGSLLAATSLARVPVLGVQVLQATYVARIAALVASRDPRARTWCRAVAALSVAAAASCLAGMVALGPWLVALLFGDDLAPDRTTCALVGAGIGLFLVASVANDLAVATGRSAWAGATWLVAVAVGAAALLVVDGPDAPLVPLLLASAVAAAALTRQRRGPLERAG